MYYKGEGIQQDYKEALKWLKKAAEQSYTDAQMIINEMRERRLVD